MAFLDTLADHLDLPADRRRWETPLDLAEALRPNTVRTPALELINEHLVWAATTQDARLIVSMPPQQGKSQLCSRAFPLWLLARDPGTRIVLASYESGVARRLSRQARDDVIARGQDLGLTLRDDVSAQAEWQVVNTSEDDDREGGVYAVGVGGALTSRPADVLIIDDPVKGREQADSETYRERAWEWWTDTAFTRLASGAAGAPAVMVLTRWHEDDLAGRLLAEDAALPEEEREWRFLRIPAQAEEPNAEQGIGPDPLGREPGEYMISARGTTPAQWQRHQRNARTWASLYQGRPAPLAGGAFKWEWIRPHRVGLQDVPALIRRVVAVDTTGGGSDEAGIIAAGRGTDGRTYFRGDRSGSYTAGGQWRKAWFAVLDFEADELVYESNLVKPIMVKAIKAAWRRLTEQAKALAKAELLAHMDDGWVIPAAEANPHLDRLMSIAQGMTGAGDDDVQASDDPPIALAEQLREVLPYAGRILDAPQNGPARVTGVRATTGKLTRAEPMAQAYENGETSHVGVLAAYERELVTWQEGQDSPNRLDAGVWAWVALNRSLPATSSSPAGGARRVPRGPQVGALPRRRR